MGAGRSGEGRKEWWEQGGMVGGGKSGRGREEWWKQGGVVRAGKSGGGREEWGKQGGGVVVDERDDIRPKSGDRLKFFAIFSIIIILIFFFPGVGVE